MPRTEPWFTRSSLHLAAREGSFDHRQHDDPLTTSIACGLQLSVGREERCALEGANLATTAIDHRNDSFAARLVNIGSTGVVVIAHALVFVALFVHASPRVLIAAFAGYFFMTLGIMAGYHRLLSHRSFKT